MHFTTLRKTLVIACVLIASAASAQYNWDIGFSVGAANYLGDMGGGMLTRRDFVADMKIAETRPAVGGFVRYKVNRYLSVKTNLTWIRISGDDKLSSNPARNARNLNFRNDVVELASQAQFCFYDIYDLGRSFRHRDNFRAFVGLGVGVAYHNPKASYNGEYVALRPLTTEGESYSKVTAVIPATGGFYFTLDQYRIGFDLTWRTTFTDYLDDVSTTYADPSVLPNQLAVDLANRTDELPSVSPAFAENFSPGNKRGDASHNDSYLTSSVEFSYAFMSHSDNFHKKKHQQTVKGQGPSKFGGNKIRRGRLVWRNGKLVRIIRPKW